MQATIATFLPGGSGRSPLSKEAAYFSLLASSSSVTLKEPPGSGRPNYSKPTRVSGRYLVLELRRDVRQRADEVLAHELGGAGVVAGLERGDDLVVLCGGALDALGVEHVGALVGHERALDRAQDPQETRVPAAA